MFQLTIPIGRLRLAAILEGISYLLFAVTMPLKYMLEIPEPNFVVGLAHGILFIAYNFLVLQNALIYRWGWGKALWSFAASIIPFGTFVADAKWFKPQQVEEVG